MSFATSLSRFATHARTGTRYGRLLAIAFLSATLVGTTACGDDDDGGSGPSSINGTYNLILAGGEPVAGEGEGQFVIDGTDWQMHLESADGTVDDEGTLERTGSTIQFSSDAFGDEFAGSVSGRRLTIDYNFGGDIGEAELVFER
jgi:hypothetical protein